MIDDAAGELRAATANRRATASDRRRGVRCSGGDGGRRDRSARSISTVQPLSAAMRHDFPLDSAPAADLREPRDPPGRPATQQALGGEPAPRVRQASSSAGGNGPSARSSERSQPTVRGLTANRATCLTRDLDAAIAEIRGQLFKSR